MCKLDTCILWMMHGNTWKISMYKDEECVFFQRKQHFCSKRGINIILARNPWKSWTVPWMIFKNDERSVSWMQAWEEWWGFSFKWSSRIKFPCNSNGCIQTETLVTWLSCPFDLKNQILWQNGVKDREKWGQWTKCGKCGGKMQSFKSGHCAKVDTRCITYD